MNKDGLRSLIQEKKESKDYYTVRNGLNTERDCFEAIEALGARKTLLKNEIKRMLDAGVDPEKDVKLQSVVLAANEIHQMQRTVINDVCARFEVISPEMDKVQPSDALLSLKRPYWDWYRDQYKLYYGKAAPEVFM